MTQENMTTVGAVGAITSPAWLPTLHTFSTIAAEMAPILGVAWLVIQIVAKIISIRKDRRHVED